MNMHLIPHEREFSLPLIYFLELSLHTRQHRITLSVLLSSLVVISFDLVLSQFSRSRNPSIDFEVDCMSSCKFKMKSSSTVQSRNFFLQDYAT